MPLLTYSTAFQAACCFSSSWLRARTAILAARAGAARLAVNATLHGAGRSLVEHAPELVWAAACMVRSAGHETVGDLARMLNGRQPCCGLMRSVPEMSPGSLLLLLALEHPRHPCRPPHQKPALQQITASFGEGI